LILIKLVLRDTVILPLWKPNSKKVFVASLGVAFLTLLISNVIVSMGTIFGEAVGFEFEAAESPAPQSFTGYLWQVLSVAIVPAVVEEFAVRGVMLQSLRKYGDLFAMIVSSLFFGLMHGNCLQAPFAFILGMVIAWLVIKTDSLWTGIAIHFMNNLYATTLLALGEICSMGVYVAIVASVNIIGALLGVAAIIWFVDKKEVKLELRKVYKWEPYVVALCAVPMTAAIIMLVKMCLETINYVGLS
ncbi:MAG: CPBP family intramembrane metalloprotease, partial [Clostridia bacterium]|nr:CPBP family intramembrane metalloprotease [Clostridia bacterium]